MPSNLEFVPVDLEKHSLLDGLQTHGYNPDAPAVFSWLGLVMYLTPAAISGTLRTLASLAPATEIIFQYTVPDELLDEETRRVRAVVMAGAGSSQ